MRQAKQKIEPAVQGRRHRQRQDTITLGTAIIAETPTSMPWVASPSGP
jgi:hypothetical protein